jgi:hypothetical protein
MSAKDWKPYLGTYRTNDEQLEVEYKNGNLLAHSTAEKCELRPMARARFYCVGNDVNVEFDRDARGKVIGLRVEHPDVDEKYSRKN